jgi:hypothetical protein
MKLPHLHSHHDEHSDRDEREIDEGLATANYDAQADLARPTDEADTHPSDAFAPFAGELSPPGPSTGYDVERDTGINPG